MQDGNTTPRRMTGATLHSELERCCVSENNLLFQRMKRCGILLVVEKKHWGTCDGKVSGYHGERTFQLCRISEFGANKTVEARV